MESLAKSKAAAAAIIASTPSGSDSKTQFTRLHNDNNSNIENI